MNLSKHFNTAARIHAGLLTLMLMGVNGAAAAQSMSDEVLCRDVFGVQITSASVHTEGAQASWWFEPYAGVRDDAGAELPRRLPLSLGDSEQVLAAQRDTIVMQWQSARADADRWAHPQTYLIVREGAPIKTDTGIMLGQFVRLIAKAHWGADVWVQQPTRAQDVLRASYPWLAPLRIARSVSEIEARDRIIPRACLQANAAPSSPASAPVMKAATAVTETARIVGLMDAGHTDLLGAKNSIAVIDQGAHQGVQMNQMWTLMTPLHTTTRIDEARHAVRDVHLAKARGQVRVIEVHEDFSLVQIEEVAQEVVRGALLRRMTGVE